MTDLDALRRAHAYIASIVATVREPLLVLDGDLRVRTANDSFCRAFGVARDQAEGRLIYDLGNGQWNIPELRRLLEQVLPRDEAFNDFEVGHTFEHIGRRTMLLNARRLLQAGDRDQAILLAIEDITARTRGQADSARLAAIVASSQDAIIGNNLDGIITSWNRGAQELFGYAAEEAIGQPVLMLLPAGRHHEETRILERILRGEAVEPYETVRRRKDATLVDVSLAVSPVLDANGRIVGGSKIARDIGPRKRVDAALAESQARLHAQVEAANRLVANLRESEGRFRMLADNMDQLAWICEELGNVTWYNQRWLDYTGLSFDEMKAWGWSKVQHPDHVERVVEGVKRSARTGEPWDDTFPLRGKDGVYRWFLSRAIPIRDDAGAIVRWFGTNTDVTAQRELADELRRSAAELSEADRRKNVFLATLAHELRNPLAPIRHALQILRLQRGDNPPAGRAPSGDSERAGTTAAGPPQGGRAPSGGSERSERGGTLTSEAASDMLDRQVMQMVRLVDDLLDSSRISRGTVELRRAPMDLLAAVQQALETARPACDAKRIELEVAVPLEPMPIDADSTRLVQVLGNLLNNACKFTNEGGRVVVAVERQGDEGVITIRDNGIGIAADMLPRIFDMFVQADSSVERATGGLGIGLTLAKQLVELHGGKVKASSEGAGRGSVFEVRLPLVVGGAPAQQPGAEARPMTAAHAATAAHTTAAHTTAAHTTAAHTQTQATARRILVVDDNRDAADSLAELLRMSGHETRLAHDGLEAVQAAAHFRPELVLLDIGLPKLNGYEAARRIRAQPWGREMVLVALTGWGQHEDRQKSSDAGFDNHVVKPVNYDDLMALVNGLPSR